MQNKKPENTVALNVAQNTFLNSHVAKVGIFGKTVPKKGADQKRPLPVK